MEVNVFERIKSITEKRGIATKKLASAIGMSEQNYYRMVRENSIKITTLGKILSFLRMSESDFFSDQFSDMVHAPEFKSQLNEPIIDYSQQDKINALVERDLQMMETLIKSIRQTLNH